MLEIVSDYNKNTYRAVYAVKIGDEDLCVTRVPKKIKQRN